MGTLHCMLENGADLYVNEVQDICGHIALHARKWSGFMRHLWAHCTAC